MSINVVVEDEYGGYKCYHGYHVDCWVDWDSDKLRLVKHSEDNVVVGEIDLPDYVSCVKEYDSENGHYIVWTNPKYNYAVSINVEKVEI